MALRIYQRTIEMSSINLLGSTDRTDSNIPHPKDRLRCGPLRSARMHCLKVVLAKHTLLDVTFTERLA